MIGFTVKSSERDRITCWRMIMKIRVLAFLLCLSSVLSAAAAGNLPAVALDADNLVVEWRDFVEGRRSAAKLVRSNSEAVPFPILENRAVLLPVDFKETDLERMCWDIPVRIDMTAARGISFDFYCADISCFSGFSFYLRADGRWLHGKFAPEQSGRWCRIRMLKQAFKEDSTTSRVRGCRQVDCIRLSGWHLKDQNTNCALANLGVITVESDLLIVRGVSSSQSDGKQGEFTRYARNLEKTLGTLHLDCVSVDDYELNVQHLQKARIVIFAYSALLPPNVMPLLENFVKQGGRIISFYNAPNGLNSLLGVRQGAWIKDENGNFSGFARVGDGLPHQPAFTPQASWNAHEFTPDTEGGKTGRVVAVWRDSRGEDTDHPAITVTDTGAMFGHVWLAEDQRSGGELLLSVIGALAPAVLEKQARQSFAAIGRFDDCPDFEAFKAIFERQQPRPDSRDLFRQTERSRAQAGEALEQGRWFESTQAARAAAELAVRSRCSLFDSIAGEHRAFWCHSAFGLRNRDWDESIRFLKQHGFNVIIPNMSWGATAYYPSEVLPVHSDVAKRGDQIKACLAACRKYGVECHIWKVCWKTGHHATADVIDRLHAQGRLQADKNGGQEQLWLCPSHPENQRMEIDAQLEVVRNYAVDGIHFDYIRYPGSTHCFCSGCRERFEKQIGERIEAWPAEVLRGGRFYARYLEFRRGNITQVVRAVAERAHEIRSGISISAAVFRNAPSDRDVIGQDWQLWCEKGWLDFVCPMNYLDSTQIFENVVQQQKQFVGNVPLYPGIGLSCWKDESSYPLKLSRQIESVRKLGLKGFTIFNFDENAEFALPFVRLGVTKPRD